MRIGATFASKFQKPISHNKQWLQASVRSGQTGDCCPWKESRIFVIAAAKESSRLRSCPASREFLHYATAL